MIEATIDDSAVQDFLDGMMERASNLRDPLAEAGQLAVDFVHATIDEEGRGSWAPAVVPTGHPLLYDSGALYHGVYYEVSGDSVTVGDSVAYADIQNASREFLYLDSDTEDKIAEILAQHFAE